VFCGRFVDLSGLFRFLVLVGAGVGCMGGWGWLGSLGDGLCPDLCSLVLGVPVGDVWCFWLLRGVWWLG